MAVTVAMKGTNRLALQKPKQRIRCAACLSRWGKVTPKCPTVGSTDSAPVPARTNSTRIPAATRLRVMDLLDTVHRRACRAPIPALIWCAFGDPGAVVRRWEGLNRRDRRTESPAETGGEVTAALSAKASESRQFTCILTPKRTPHRSVAVLSIARWRKSSKSRSPRHSKQSSRCAQVPACQRFELQSGSLDRCVHQPIVKSPFEQGDLEKTDRSWMRARKGTL
jgi:hypothetical protein